MALVYNLNLDNSNENSVINRIRKTLIIIDSTLDQFVKDRKLTTTSGWGGFGTKIAPINKNNLYSDYDTTLGSLISATAYSKNINIETIEKLNEIKQSVLTLSGRKL